MSDRKEFHGCVGQNVFGNVNEAPRNNIFQLNIGTTDRRSLTSLQRKMITTKVKELVARGGLDPLDVYRILLSDFGVDTMDEFPRDKYVEAMFVLDYWVAELADSRQKDRQRGRPDDCSDSGNVAQAVALSIEPVIKRMTGYSLAMQSILAVLLTGAFVFAVIFKPVIAEAQGEQHDGCSIDGKSFSVGSWAKMPNGEILECVDSSDHSAAWSGSRSRKAALDKG